MADRFASLVPFDLEDFFDEYEHRPGLINLASSDALPWSIIDLENKGATALADTISTLQYPDVKKHLYPSLEAFCKPPTGVAVLPTAGASEAIALIMHELAATRTPHDSQPVGLPTPAYGAFRGLAALLGLPIETYGYLPSQDWEPDLDALADLSGRCSALVITNPHNPTGHVMDPILLEKLSNAISSSGGTMIVDEVFRVADENTSAMMLGPHVVVIGSLSKTYGLPGLRLGWVAANEERISRLRTVQQYLSLSLNTMTVAVGAAILDRHQEYSRADLIHENRRILTNWSKPYAGILAISAPTGGTTACLTIDTHFDEMELFNRFIHEGVLLVPGKRFGFAAHVPWFRLGYATDSTKLREGLAKLSTVMSKLRVD